MQVKVGDLVRPTKRINFGTPFTSKRNVEVEPTDVGLVLQVWEPTIQYPEGAAEIRFSGNREATLMWKEIEIISESR
jgi:hypothetical protein|tara:strand:- start:253 stop:483 length:231 start_codon:yes stop_codon:yes gene_type:complete